MSPAGATPKPWALLAYTVADDAGDAGELDDMAKHELKAICDAADFGQVSVATQVDFKHIRGVFRAAITTKSRGFEEVSADDHPLWRKIKKSLSGDSTLQLQMDATDLNAARASVLRSFLRYGHEQCPAERHVIYFYGHANGPMGLFYDAAAKQRVPNTLRLNDLASSLENPDRRAAVIVFRDCYMNTLETASQLGPVADFMVASQSEMPIAGVWPWLTFMTTLMPGAASGDVARAIAVQLGRFMDEPANRQPFADVPISLIDLGAAVAVHEPLKALAGALDEARRDPQRRMACAAALEGARVGYPDDPKQPGDPALVDVLTMCDSLQRLGPDPVAGPATALGDVVRGRVVAWHHSQKDRYRGISLYYKPVRPKDIERSYIEAGDEAEREKDAASYKVLSLSEATGWHRIALDPLTPSGKS
jgi:hypothetical protein